jgi:riboflavin synthase
MMFTGLVADQGEVISIEKRDESALMQIKTELAAQIRPGDSVSVSGVCLTAIKSDESSFTADVMIQTLRLTTLGELSIQSQVNLELAAQLSDRMGGHIVQGHVDGIGEVLENSPGEKWNKFRLRIPEALAKYIVNQGSIAIEGVSLTVGEILSDEVTLWLIPETLARTNLAAKRVGARVNIEVDIIAKYVEKLVGSRT